MPNRISFATNKGGVGKSTSTAFCAEILASAGYKVLVVDMDSQGNLTRIITQNSIYQYSGNTIMEAFQTGNADPYIINVKEGLDLIPAEDRLAAFSRFIYSAKVNNPFAVLKRLLEPVESRYDFVFVDAGPSLGDHMINTIVYADRIYIPVDTADLAMDAMVRFIEFVDESRMEGHTNAVIDGILLTMKDGRQTRYEQDISDGIRDAYGDLVFNTEIRRKIKIKEMSAKGIDVFEDAMGDYMALTEEIIERTIGKGKKVNEQQERNRS